MMIPVSFPDIRAAERAHGPQASGAAPVEIVSVSSPAATVAA
ncbi:MAG TPA: hypothetical protein VGC14_06800 [Rhizobium sp.]